MKKNQYKHAELREPIDDIYKSDKDNSKNTLHRCFPSTQFEMADEMQQMEKDVHDSRHRFALYM